MSFIKTYGRCYQKFDNNPIIKTDPTYIAPTAKENLEYTSEALELLNAGSTNDGTIKYSLDGNDWSTSIPTGTEALIYTCYWKLEGDANHNDVEQSSISVEIASAAPAVESVDLGLPSGLKWAKTNLGATNEEDNGLYFAWGETTGYADAAARNTALGRTDGFSDDAYTATGGAAITDSVLTLAHDAANTYMGGDWRMPTGVEVQELINNTDNEWTTIKGVLGRKFMKKSDHSVYIFLPLAGNYFGTSNFFTYVDYWSSTKNNSSAIILHSTSSYLNFDTMSMYIGLPIRAVQPAS